VDDWSDAVTSEEIRMLAKETVETGRDQQAPALHSSVFVTRHEAGVTIGFPYSSDSRLETRRRAWRFFEVGILLLVGTVVCYAVCSMAGWSGIIPMLAVTFFAGIVTLMAAASRMCSAWNHAPGNDFLCQLAIAGNLLIRTWGDQRKQIWYRHEIRAIWIEDKLNNTVRESEGCNTGRSTHAFQLVIELQSGAGIVLLADGSNLPAGVFRPKAELEWIAALLRQALGLEPVERPPSPMLAEDRASSQAIQEIAASVKETRITP
jgi:uncharacterized membrane protein YgdD (TMEM256/DUF423 family)